jgi:hypothetical protein
MNYLSYLTVTLGGKQRGLKFNMEAVEQFSRHFNYKTTPSAFYATVYAGLCGNATVKQEEIDFTYEEVCDWVDELCSTEEGELVMEKAYNIFLDCTTYKSWLRKIKEATEKIRVLKEEEDEKKSQMTNLTGSSSDPLQQDDSDGVSTTT